MIARGILLADATSALRPMLVGDSAIITQRLLNDAGVTESPLDLALSNPAGRRILLATERLILPGLLLHWLARKRLLNDIAADSLAAGCRQIVILGAGLDTLAIRMQHTCPCFELDHPATQSVKQLAAPSSVTLIAADLSIASPAQLLSHTPHFSPRVPTLFIAEGLLMYLPAARVESLFNDLVSIAASGSRFAFTFMEDRPGRHIAFQNSRPVVNWWLNWRTEPFRWALRSEDAPCFLENLNWCLLDLQNHTDLRRRYLTPHNLANAPLAIGENRALAEIPLP